MNIKEGSAWIHRCINEGRGDFGRESSSQSTAARGIAKTAATSLAYANPRSNYLPACARTPAPNVRYMARGLEIMRAPRILMTLLFPHQPAIFY